MRSTIRVRNLVDRSTYLDPGHLFFFSIQQSTHTDNYTYRSRPDIHEKRHSASNRTLIRHLETNDAQTTHAVYLSFPSFTPYISFGFSVSLLASHLLFSFCSTYYRDDLFLNSCTLLRSLKGQAKMEDGWAWRYGRGAFVL